MRRLTSIVSEGFIWGVGITRPSAAKERSAAAYITLILIGSLMFAAGMFFFLASHIV